MAIFHLWTQSLESIFSKGCTPMGVKIFFLKFSPKNFTSNVPDLEGATTMAIPLGFKAFFKHSSNCGLPSSKKRQSAQMTTS